MNRRSKAIFINIVLIILEIIGIIMGFIEGGVPVFKYYTQESNILCLISSIIVLFYLIKNKKYSKSVSLFRYISVVCLTITCLVVIFVLAPMYNFDYYWLLYRNSSLYLHLLCPLLSVISFLFFEDHNLKDKYDSIRGLYYTIFYAIVAILLNIIGLLEGPYPFLMIRKNGVILSIIWLIIMIGISYLISFGLLKIKNKIGAKK